MEISPNRKAIAAILMIAIWSVWVESTYALSFINFDAARPTIASSPALNGVGVVSSDIGSCTGSAISSTVVLTAAHCFDGPDTGGRPDNATAFFYIHDENGAVRAFSGTAQSHPEYPGWAAGHNHDIAVLTLNFPLPNSVNTYPIYSGPAYRVLLNDEMTVAGYGRYTYTQEVLLEISPGNIRTFDISLELPRSFLEGYSGQNIYNVYNPRHSSIEAVYDNPGLVPTKQNGFSVEAAINPGDSGGPVFLTSFNEEAIIGVTSYFYDGKPPFLKNGLTEPRESFGATFVGNHTDWLRSVAPDIQLFSVPKTALCPRGVICKPGAGDETLVLNGALGNPEDIPDPYFLERLPTTVPEPNTFYFLLLGLGSLAFLSTSKLCLSVRALSVSLRRSQRDANRGAK